MKKYFGLRGQSLNRVAIALVTLPSFMAYGYNQSVAGGLLTLQEFADQFPQMDTIFTTGSQQAYNSKIQGKKLNYVFVLIETGLLR